ncbi:MAG: hypothetical protein NVS1B4_22840 [Gemmatimonadaceae bacterium]
MVRTTISPAPSPSRHAVAWTLVAAVSLVACTNGRADAGGRSRDAGLAIATLPAGEVAAAYDAALQQAFDRGPALSLVLSPALLPRSGGYDTTAHVPQPLARALQATGAFRGLCAPRHDRRKNAPHCDIEMPGYAIRVSDPFAMPGDSLRLYLTAERYRGRADSARYAAPFAFEERYTLVRGSGSWVVARKERKMIT